jgi:YD repeat-containing protein
MVLDAASRMVAFVDPLNNRNTVVYDAANRQTATINALGNRSTTIYNAAGQTTASVNPLSARTSMSIMLLVNHWRRSIRSGNERRRFTMVLVVR